MMMCGRFVGFRSLEELKNFFPIDRTTCKAAENYNVAPSQEVLVILKHAGENWLDRLHWGLVPFWAKDISIGSKLINARSESVAEKPSFRNAFKKRRCLILADGFYEWTGGKGHKQPMYITLPDRKPFAFAGLWEVWNSKGPEATVYRSCTILTTRASESIQNIHHRMPVVLKTEVYDLWLEPTNQNITELKQLLKDSIHREFISYPVSKQVNSTRKNDPSCVEPAH
jgi:putative SOS response-associated peptidase YedK